MIVALSPVSAEDSSSRAAVVAADHHRLYIVLCDDVNLKPGTRRICGCSTSMCVTDSWPCAQWVVLGALSRCQSPNCLAVRVRTLRLVGMM